MIRPPRRQSADAGSEGEMRGDQPTVVPREQWVDNNQFAKQEIQRRRTAPVLVKAEDIEEQREVHNQPYIVDPRLGFNQKWFRLWIRRGKRGLEEGEEAVQGWGLGHRHSVEA